MRRLAERDLEQNKGGSPSNPRHVHEILSCISAVVVVHKDHFRDFLRCVDEDLTALANSIWNNRSALDEQLDLMTQEFAK
jgi:hypothetical protein